VTIPGIGGGAESTTATVVGQATIHDERAEADFPSMGLVAHEAAHQWWGDLVTCRTWGHTWLNESFATYAEYLFTRHDRGEDEALVNVQEKRAAYFQEARTRYQRPIVLDRWRHPNDNFDRHTYQKGAAVLHMLRDVLGDEAFFASLKRFLSEHAFQPVRTEDLQGAIRETTGQDLGWFFDEWVYRPGHPVFDVRQVWDETEKELRVTVRQVQDHGAGAPIFRMPVALSAVTDAGTASKRVWLEKETEEVVIPVSSRPLLVRFDPEDVLLKEWTFAKTAEELAFQLGRDGSAGRIWAAGELGKATGDARAAAALTEAARSDPFWRVREAAVQAIGAWKRAEELAFLKARALDSSSRVRAAALRALGDLGRRDLVSFLVERFERDGSYLVQAEAVTAVGRCGDESAVAFLQKAAQMRSPRDVVGKAATRALEGFRKRPAA
jgi:aminopeptidase N